LRSPPNTTAAGRVAAASTSAAAAARASSTRQFAARGLAVAPSTSPQSPIASSTVEATRADARRSAARPVAILFGGERAGLSNEEIARCDALLTIPTRGGYGSLNLAQSVQVVCYEIAMAARAPAAEPRAAEPASADEMEAMHAHLERVMRRSGFMHEGNAASLAARVRRLLARARPDGAEVRILRGFLAALERGLPHAD